MAVAEISLEWNKPTSQTRRAVPIVEVYSYSITNPMFFFLTVSLLWILFPVNITIFLTYRGLSYYYYYLCSLTRTQQVIWGNSKKLKRNKNTEPPKYNCIKKENWPLKGWCQKKRVVYKDEGLDLTSKE